MNSKLLIVFSVISFSATAALEYAEIPNTLEISSAAASKSAFSSRGVTVIVD